MLAAESVRWLVVASYSDLVDIDRLIVQDRALIRVVSVEPAEQLLLFLLHVHLVNAAVVHTDPADLVAGDLAVVRGRRKHKAVVDLETNEVVAVVDERDKLAEGTTRLELDEELVEAWGGDAEVEFSVGGGDWDEMGVGKLVQVDVVGVGCFQAATTAARYATAAAAACCHAVDWEAWRTVDVYDDVDVFALKVSLKGELVFEDRHDFELWKFKNKWLYCELSVDLDSRDKK